MSNTLTANKRITTSREVENQLKVGVTTVIQVISPSQKVEFRHPARMVGWSRGKYIILDLERLSKASLIKISASLRERCVLRYIEGNQAFALESRLLEVFEMQKGIFLSCAWSSSINIYQYRSDVRVRAELSCNVRGLDETDATLHGQITDLHLRGCCLILPTDSLGTYKIGDLVQLELPVSTSEEFPSVCAEIRNIRTHEEMSILGLALRDLSTDAEGMLRQVMYTSAG